MSKWKRAKKLVDEGNVELDIDADNAVHFKVGRHFVIYDKRRDRWSCTCMWFSMKLTDCSHIIACKYKLREYYGKQDNERKQSGTGGLGNTGEDGIHSPENVEKVHDDKGEMDKQE